MPGVFYTRKSSQGLPPPGFLRLFTCAFSTSFAYNFAFPLWARTLLFLVKQDFILFNSAPKLFSCSGIENNSRVNKWLRWQLSSSFPKLPVAQVLSQHSEAWQWHHIQAFQHIHMQLHKPFNKLQGTWLGSSPPKTQIWVLKYLHVLWKEHFPLFIGLRTTLDNIPKPNFLEVL